MRHDSRDVEYLFSKALQSVDGNRLFLQLLTPMSERSHLCKRGLSHNIVQIIRRSQNQKKKKNVMLSQHCPLTAKSINCALIAYPELLV